jgi:hypothetical protein
MQLKSARSAAPVLLVAWAGLWVHELHRVPELFGLTPDGSLPFIAVIAGLIAWRRPPSLLLLAYGTIHLAGAIATVLPLPFLPFYPEQTVSHYAVHAVYAASQLPLMIYATARGGIQAMAQP